MNDSDARFTELRVTGIFQADQIIFAESFETPVPDLLSICTQQ